MILMDTNLHSGRSLKDAFSHSHRHLHFKKALDSEINGKLSVPEKPEKTGWVSYPWLLIFWVVPYIVDIFS
ncbi:MAG: hypothetical protein LBR60_04475 [Fibrobacter sp.]|jgi:hypothetical protein|nr:hypothetical protein [Fibrobacter sp.]